MEPAVKKLLEEKVAIHRRRYELDKRERAVDTALEILDIRVARQAMLMGYVRAARLEEQYESSQPFRDKTLSAACLAVINSHEGMGLDKNQVEYLLTIGGYPFEAKDPTNSVEVTLRKLAKEGKCEVETGSGSSASRYRLLRNRKVTNDVEDSGATKE